MLMKKFILFWIAGIFFVLGNSGCSTPPRRVMPLATPPELADSKEMAARFERFRTITAGFQVRGIGIYPEAFENRYTPAEIVSRIVKYNFNRVYCYITTEKALNDNMIALLRELDNAGIPAEVVLFQRDFYRKVQTNQLLRSIVWQYPTLKDVAQKVIDFNRELPPEIRKFAGITIVTGAHTFTNANVERSRGQLYAWAEDRYGIGRDNDMLMRQMFELLKEIAALPDLPPLTLGIQDFYHENAVAGKLSCGSINDFAKIGKVMIINRGNVATQLVKQVENELKYASGKPVLISIPLAEHTALNSGKLRRRDWNDFCRALEYAGKHFKENKSCGGIVVSPLSVIEFLRQER